MTSALPGRRHAGRGQPAVRSTRDVISAVELSDGGNLDAATAAALSCFIEGHLMRGAGFCG